MLDLALFLLGMALFMCYPGGVLLIASGHESEDNRQIAAGFVLLLLPTMVVTLCQM